MTGTRIKVCESIAMKPGNSCSKDLWCKLLQRQQCECASVWEVRYSGYSATYSMEVCRRMAQKWSRCPWIRKFDTAGWNAAGFREQGNRFRRSGAM